MIHNEGMTTPTNTAIESTDTADKHDQSNGLPFFDEGGSVACYAIVDAPETWSPILSREGDLMCYGRTLPLSTTC